MVEARFVGEQTREEIAVICSTKRNLHTFLTCDMDYALPALEFTTLEWLGAIWRGDCQVSLHIHKLIIALLNRCFAASIASLLTLLM